MDARYGNAAGCSTFASEIQNVWDRYFSIKKINYKDSNIISRTDQASTDINAYKASVTALGDVFDDSMTTLQNSIDTLIDP